MHMFYTFQVEINRYPSLCNKPYDEPPPAPRSKAVLKVVKGFLDSKVVPVTRNDFTKFCPVINCKVYLTDKILRGALLMLKGAYWIKDCHDEYLDLIPKGGKTRYYKSFRQFSFYKVLI